MWGHTLSDVFFMFKVNEETIVTLLKLLHEALHRELVCMISDTSTAPSNMSLNENLAIVKNGRSFTFPF